jgi:hypothetical protein
LTRIYLRNQLNIYEEEEEEEEEEEKEDTLERLDNIHDYLF